MFFLLMLVVALMVTVQSVVKDKFNLNVKGSIMFFSAGVSFVAMLGFLSVTRSFEFDGALLLYSFGFAVCYALCTVCGVLSILYGPLALTSLVISCSLMVPTLYGIIVQGLIMKTGKVSDAVSPTLIVGIILLFVTLFLVRNRDEKSDKKATFKWLICVLLTFLGNGLCSVIQAAKQDFYGNGGNEIFMVLALLMVTVLLLLVAFLSEKERKSIRLTVKKSWYMMIICGGANAIANLLVMFFNKSNVPASLTFPVISGGGLMMVFIYSIVIKKEKFTTVQRIGYLLGAVSLVLMNI